MILVSVIRNNKSTLQSASWIIFPDSATDALNLAVKQVSNGVFTFYNNDNEGVGLFPKPYNWWQSAVAWDSLVNYWYLTGDSSHNDQAQAALVAQKGPDNDYMVPNQTISEGNDNQTVWGLAALTAAERNFPQVDGQDASWEDIARNVFDTLAARWDTSTCGGGLRWQIFTFNDGYNWKNAASQALFFQLAARLASFTGNQTYVDWATRTYDWTRESGLIGDDFAVYNGVNTDDNCTSVARDQWSRSAASFAFGSAVLANFVSIRLFLASKPTLPSPRRVFEVAEARHDLDINLSRHAIGSLIAADSSLKTNSFLSLADLRRPMDQPYQLPPVPPPLDLLPLRHPHRAAL